MNLVAIVRALRAVSLGVWLGGIVTVFVALPVIFKILPNDQTLAGLIAGEILKKASMLRIVLAVVAMAAEGVLIARSASDPATGWRRKLPRLGLSCAALVVAVSAGWLEPKIHALRETIGDFSPETKGSPERIEFGKLHGLAFGLMALEALFVVVALVAALL